jgi:acyl-CoA synthetase (NDP forming)
VDSPAVARILAGARDAGGGYLPPEDVRAVLRAYGIPVVGSRLAASADEAVAAADAVGYPVVMKIVSADVLHKTDVGGVALGLRTPGEVRHAHEAMLASVRSALPNAAIDGVLVEQHVPGGRETIIGMTLDPAFGPVLMFGLGGIYVEALGDVVFRVQPVSDVDAHEMVGAIRGVKLLDGIRGEPPADRALLAEVIQRVSQLVGDHPDIVEMDINPFVAFEHGGIALDARIRVRAAH